MCHSTGLVGTSAYNNRLQPCRISVKSSGTAPSTCSDTHVGNILDYTYNFSLGIENNGNVTSVTNNITPGRSQSYTYDELNRISTAVAQATSGQFCWGQDFTYDAWANLTNIILDPNRPSCSATGLSAAMVGNNQLSAPPYHYDAAGNLTADGTNSYTFNAENQVVTVAGVTYTYDGGGARVKKSNGKLYWNGDGVEALDETDTSGNLTDEYIFFGGARIARRDASNNVVYYFSDHLGTTHVVTNSSGTIQDDSDFYPFGGERVVTSSSGNAYKFTGKERDSESGLDNFGARYYASTTGRFLSPDDTKYASLADPQTWNLYSYVSNHPLTMTDPTGHAPDGSPGHPCLPCDMPRPEGGGSPNAIGYGIGTSVEAETITIFSTVISDLDPHGVPASRNGQQSNQAPATRTITATVVEGKKEEGTIGDFESVWPGVEFIVKLTANLDFPSGDLSVSAKMSFSRDKKAKGDVILRATDATGATIKIGNGPATNPGSRTLYLGVRPYSRTGEFGGKGVGNITFRVFDSKGNVQGASLSVYIHGWDVPGYDMGVSSKDWVTKVTFKIP